MHFTYDDSFIIYRYADNLAQGYGFSWNYDGIPEAGFTSYFHTLLIAAGIKLGFDPLVFSKLATIFGGIIAMIVVGLIVRELTERKFDFYFLSSLVLGFIPAFGLHAISGMETIIYVMLFALSSYSYLVFLRTNKRKHLAILVTLITFSAFTRYEAGLLTIGIIVHYVYNRWILKNSTNFKNILVFTVPIIFVIALLVWNYSYLEQFLPNPFFQKSTTDLSDLFRNLNSMSFVLVLMIVHIFLIALNLKEVIKNPKASYLVIQIFVVLIPFLFISQWGNFQHRYYFQIIPLIISLSVFSFYLIKPKIIEGQKHPKFIIGVILLIFVLYPLPSNWDVSGWSDSFSNSMENTHIKIGKILGKYDNLKDNTIATVVDAGAVPYYSQWKVYDFTFNDRHYTKHGFSADYFYQQNPVIITLNFANSYAREDLPHLEDNVINYLQTRGEEWALHPEFENFELIASYPKILIFVEKEFASQNPQLMQDLIDNSSHPLNIP